MYDVKNRRVIRISITEGTPLMKVLVVGSGGREHSLCWAIAKSPKCKRLYAAPGNPGMAQVAECVAISVDQHDALVQFSKDESIDFVVV